MGQFAILTEFGPRKDIACTYGVPGDAREANARLIAAAPDLFEALRMMLHGTERDCGRVCMPSNEAIRTAFAAIDKALGEAK